MGKRTAEDLAEQDERWAEFVRTFRFQAGDRVRFTAKAIEELRGWAYRLKRPDTRGIYNAETRATVVGPMREHWGHTMTVNIDGHGEDNFYAGYWEKV